MNIPKLKPIRIRVEGGEWQDLLGRPIGTLAVHRNPVISNSTGRYEHRLQLWSVTHLPTGMRVFGMPTLETAVAAMRRLRKGDLGDLLSMDVPTDHPDYKKLASEALRIRRELIEEWEQPK